MNTLTLTPGTWAIPDTGARGVQHRIVAVDPDPRQPTGVLDVRRWDSACGHISAHLGHFTRPAPDDHPRCTLCLP